MLRGRVCVVSAFPDSSAQSTSMVAPPGSGWPSRQLSTLNRLVLLTQCPALAQTPRSERQPGHEQRWPPTALPWCWGAPVPRKVLSPSQSWPLLAALETSQRMTAEQRRA